MSRKNRITESNPRTGALPSEQVSQNKQGGAQSSLGMLENDKLIYQLVEENVGFCGEQFSENLRFNSEVLTNTLYDNIYKLLGEKFQEDDFVNWVVDELVKKGFVFKTQDQVEQEKQTDSSEQPKTEVVEPEVVYELDDSAYEDLKQKVYAAVELIKANKLRIFQLLATVDDDIKEIENTRNQSTTINASLLRKRDEEIKKLVQRIQGNSETISQYIDSQNQSSNQYDSDYIDIQDSAQDTFDLLQGQTSDISRRTDNVKGLISDISHNNNELGDVVDSVDGTEVKEVVGKIKEKVQGKVKTIGQTLSKTAKKTSGIVAEYEPELAEKVQRLNGEINRLKAKGKKAVDTTKKVFGKTKKVASTITSITKKFITKIGDALSDEEEQDSSSSKLKPVISKPKIQKKSPGKKSIKLQPQPTNTGKIFEQIKSSSTDTTSKSDDVFDEQVDEQVDEENLNVTNTSDSPKDIDDGLNGESETQDVGDDSSTQRVQLAKPSKQQLNIKPLQNIQQSNYPVQKVDEYEISQPKTKLVEVFDDGISVDGQITEIDLRRTPEYVEQVEYVEQNTQPEQVQSIQPTIQEASSEQPKVQPQIQQVINQTNHITNVVVVNKPRIVEIHKDDNQTIQTPQVSSETSSDNTQQSIDISSESVVEESVEQDNSTSEKEEVTKEQPVIQNVVQKNTVINQTVIQQNVIQQQVDSEQVVTDPEPTSEQEVEDKSEVIESNEVVQKPEIEPPSLIEGDIQQEHVYDEQDEQDDVEVVETIEEPTKLNIKPSNPKSILQKIKGGSVDVEDADYIEEPISNENQDIASVDETQNEYILPQPSIPQSLSENNISSFELDGLDVVQKQKSTSSSEQDADFDDENDYVKTKPSTEVVEPEVVEDVEPKTETPSISPFNIFKKVLLGERIRQILLRRDTPEENSTNSKLSSNIASPVKSVEKVQSKDIDAKNVLVGINKKIQPKHQETIESQDSDENIQSIESSNSKISTSLKPSSIPQINQTSEPQTNIGEQEEVQEQEEQQTQEPLVEQNEERSETEQKEQGDEVTEQSSVTTSIPPSIKPPEIPQQTIPPPIQQPSIPSGTFGDVQKIDIPSNKSEQKDDKPVDEPVETKKEEQPKSEESSQQKQENEKKDTSTDNKSEKKDETKKDESKQDNKKQEDAGDDKDKPKSKGDSKKITKLTPITLLIPRLLKKGFKGSDSKKETEKGKDKKGDGKSKKSETKNKKKALFGLGLSALIPFKKKKKKKDIDKKKKKSLWQKIKGGISKGWNKLKSAISKSAVGKLWRGLKKGFKAIGKAVKAVWRGVKAVGRGIKKTVKTAWKATKKVGKLFVKTSYMIGKGIFSVGRAIGRGIKSLFGKGDENKSKIKQSGLSATGKRKVIKAIISFSGAALFLPLVWKGIKFIGKKIWKGIKKLGLKFLKVLGSVFSIGRGFVNKVGVYAKKIGVGIRDLSYRFLIRPIAGMMVSIFGFAMSLVMGPVNFMKSIVTAVFDRIFEALNAIKTVVVDVLKSTWSILKKILFNPITIAIIIGALFYFLKDKILGWLDGGIEGIKNNLWPKIQSIALKVWDFLKGAWNVIETVGTWLVKGIAWITDPEGWLASGLSLIWSIVKAIGKSILWVMGKSGKDNIEAFCMFLAGDNIGLVLRMLKNVMKKVWNWIRNVSLIKLIMNIVNAYVGFFLMWGQIGANLLNIICHPVKSGLLAHPIDTISNAIFKPIGDWIDKVVAIFTDSTGNEAYEDSPVEKNKEVSSKVKIAVRSLKMTGTNSEKVLNKMDELSQVSGFQGNKNVLTKIESMSNLYQTNSEQVEAYNDFLTEAWEIGKGNPSMSQRSLKTMLESGEISQKLMSAFFYYDPQTGNIKSVIPQNKIPKFLDNVRKLVNSDDDWEEKFQKIIMAFEQINMERSGIINGQGETITKFAEDISNFDLKQEGADEKLKKMVTDLNNNNLFPSKAAEVYTQLKGGVAKTRDLDSLTGTGMGTSDLFEFDDDITLDKDGKEIPVKDSDLDVKIPEKKKNYIIEGIELPKSMMVKPLPDPIDTSAEASGKSLVDQWYDHMNKRNQLLNAGVSTKKVEDVYGYKPYTYDEFKQHYSKMHPLKQSEIDALEDNKAQRLAGLRLSKDIEAYNSAGVVASKDGFKIGSEPTLINIPADGLSQRMLIFGPKWLKVQGAAGLNDAELLSMLDEGDMEARKQARKAKEAEEAKKREAERQRKREEEILNYSANVKNGFIEIKIGEDVTAMKEAWIQHMNKRNELLKGMPTDKVEKMGFVAYDWEEWKRYYRKMHGLPEDGIKRIPFDGKKKERKIDWSTRGALSAEEMAKYGVKMSEDGPVMIPMDRALEISNELLKQAKTAIGIRDGLEIMREGLVTETAELKKRNKGGMPVGIVQTGDDEGDTVASTPSPTQSFEERW